MSESIKYNEILFESIDTIVKSRIKDLNFDRTVVGTIFDDSKKQEGCYLAKVENLTLEVYSEFDKYRNGDQVSILIPNGDYNNSQKIILSRYKTQQNIQPITYVPPFQELVLMSDNLIKTKREGSLIANEGETFPFATEMLIEKIPIVQPNIVFSSLGIRASFMCLLQNYNITKGNYGFRIQLEGKNGERVNKFFSSSNMFGNPYGYTSFISQESKIDLADISFPIDFVDIYFYQDGQFSEGDALCPQSEMNKIGFEELEVYLANDVTKEKNKTFKIYTENLIYSSEEKRDIACFWYNIDKTNSYLGFSDEYDYSVKWFRDNQGVWVEDPNIVKIANSQIAQTYRITLKGNLKREKIKAVLYRNLKNSAITFGEKENSSVSFQSNILIFENISVKEDPLIADKITALNINLGANAERVFSFYGENNLLINPNENQINRELQLEYTPFQINIPERDFFKTSKIIWYIPKDNTMISYNKAFMEEFFIIFTQQDFENNFINFSLTDAEILRKNIRQENVKPNYYCFFNRKEKEANFKIFYFTIKNLYSRTASRNEIKVEATYGDSTYTASISFIFSSQSENGDMYCPIIYSLNNKNTINKNEKTLGLNIALLSPSGESIPVNGQNVFWKSLSNQLSLENTSGLNILINNPYVENRYGVIKASIKINEKVSVQSFYPIIYSENNNYYADSPITITYNKAGINPKFYKERLTLYNSLSNNEVENVQWDIIYVDKESGALLTQEEIQSRQKFLPQLYQDHILVPSFFFQNTGAFCILKGSVQGRVLWEQPLIILCDLTSENQWGEDFVISQNNNIILNLSFGVGKRDLNNSFSGLLTGMIKDPSGERDVGFYSFNQGNQICKIDSSGKILFNSPSGGSFFVDGQNFKIKTNSFELNTNNNGQEFFSIVAGTNKIIATPNDLKGDFQSLNAETFSVKGIPFMEKNLAIPSYTKGDQFLKDITLTPVEEGQRIGTVTINGEVQDVYSTTPLISSIEKVTKPILNVKVLAGEKTI